MSERMMHAAEIAGVPVDQVEIDGIVYTYPQERMDYRHIALATELSSAHVGGDIVALPVNPEEHPAQGAYFLEGEPQSADFVANMAKAIDPRFEALVETTLHDKQQLRKLHHMGEHLERGGNVVNAIPHGSLPDVGLHHALPYVALAKLGYTFRAGIMISEGVTGLAYNFYGQAVEGPIALTWACRKVWLVIPRTDKTREAEFSQVVSEEQIKQQNTVVKADLDKEQDEGGLFVTVALSGTSDKIDEHGVRWLGAPNLSALRTFAHPRTRVQIAVGEIQGAEKPAYKLWGDLRQLLDRGNETLEKQGDNIMIDMTSGLNQVVPGQNFGYRDGRR